jgi:hypothetical protein
MMKLAVKLHLLTFVGVFVEIAYCVWTLAHSAPLWVVPVILGAYHGGYVLARLPIVSKYSALARLLLVLSMLVLALGTYTVSWPLTAICILVLSTTLQALRRALKNQVSTSSRGKNLTKALAMVSASAGALAAQWLALLVMLIAGAVVLVVRGVSYGTLRHALKVGTPVRKNLLWFELLHHAHYFAYCYTFWVLLGTAFIPLVGPLFLIGWVGYFVLEWLFREHSRLYSSKFLAAGHLICAVALLGMLVTRSGPIILALWFITGIGGGTAYMLGNIPNGGDRELYEDLGHVIGCFGAALAILATGLVETSIVLGIGFALAAVVALATEPTLSYIQERNP